MPHYYKLGQIPHKRHIQFRKPDGGLYAEELVSTEGFSSIYSLVYHLYPPTEVLKIGTPVNVAPIPALENNMQHRSLKGFQVKPVTDYLESRKPVMFNSDLIISLAAPEKSLTEYFYKNASADEMIFIHDGEGVLHSMFGDLPFKQGDYVMIPRGVIYKISFNTSANRLLIVESFSPFETPRRYRNPFGQLEEHSPFCERDFKEPNELITHDETGIFEVKIKKRGQIFPYTYKRHPFDVIGWDGFYYPYTFSIHNFEPLTGRVHLPPPIHQTFQAAGFVICSFVPRMYDYHPLAIPAPYNHSNLDSDEVLYYAEGEFMSRKHVERGMISLHPMGIPHGPHPGTVEKSIGKASTGELAVMIDTFKPLILTQQALDIEDPDYFTSWVD